MRAIKTIFVSTILILSSMLVHSQDEDALESKMEKIKTAKIALITQELNLTTEEAQKFWPIYNKYSEDKKALWGINQSRKKGDYRKSLEDMSDNEVEKMLSDKMDKKTKMLELEKKYEADLKTVLPIKKIAKLHIADRKFKKQMIEKFKEHRRSKSSDEPKSPQK